METGFRHIPYGHSVELRENHSGMETTNNEAVWKPVWIKLRENHSGMETTENRVVPAQEVGCVRTIVVWKQM